MGKEGHWAVMVETPFATIVSVGSAEDFRTVSVAREDVWNYLEFEGQTFGKAYVDTASLPWKGVLRKATERINEKLRKDYELLEERSPELFAVLSRAIDDDTDYLFTEYGVQETIVDIDPNEARFFRTEMWHEGP